jgi:DNA-nicking Smr family endonuclease
MTKKKRMETGPFGALAALKKKMEEEAEKKPAKAPPAAARPESRKPPSAEEEELAFHRMMSGVVPLDRSKGVRLPKSQTPLAPTPGAEAAAKRANAKSAREAEAEAVHEHLRTLVEGGARFEVSDDGRRVEGRRLDLPPSALRTLRRGRMPIDAKLDLHGMVAGDARAALEAFLSAKHARGERCVLVVHGKGEHSPRGLGVLRGEIAAWLSQGAASEHVAAFATATDDDGGEGAAYVLLRK